MYFMCCYLLGVRDLVIRVDDFQQVMIIFNGLIWDSID